MAPKEIPKEAVEKFVQERVADQIKEASKRVIRRNLEVELAKKAEVLIQKVLADLEGRGIDTDHSEVRMIAQDVGLDTLLENGSWSSSGGSIKYSLDTRTNHDEVGCSKQPTKMVELPIEGGDVENPDTMEFEVLDPEPMDFSELDGLLDESSRLNERKDEVDIPEVELPWYQ